MTSSILAPALPAGPQRRRREPCFGRRLCAHRRPRRRARPFRGGRGGVARSGRSRPAACDLPRQPLPGSTRPLRGAGGDRRTLARAGRRPSGGHAARRQRGRSAGRGSRRVTRQARRRSASTIRPSAAQRFSTRRTPSTAFAAGLHTSMRLRTSAISGTTDARPAATRARRWTSAPVRSSPTASTGSRSTFACRKARPAFAYECRVVYNVYNALAAASIARGLLGSGGRDCGGARPRLAGVRPLRARRRRREDAHRAPDQESSRRERDAQDAAA